MSAISQIIEVADAYGKAKGLAPVTVSWRAFGDSKKLDALRNGADIQVKRAQKTMQWFSDHWPASTHWPSSVPRPVPSEKEVA